MTLLQQITMLRDRGVEWAKTVLYRRRHAPDVAALEEYVATGQHIAEMLGSRGWSLFSEHMRDRIVANKAALIAMKTEDFQSAQGLQLRELIRAQEALLKEPAFMLQRALSAERMLKRLDADYGKKK